jgi:hypothetical protein
MRRAFSSGGRSIGGVRARLVAGRYAERREQRAAGALRAREWAGRTGPRRGTTRPRWMRATQPGPARRPGRLAAGSKDSAPLAPRCGDRTFHSGSRARRAAPASRCRSTKPSRRAGHCAGRRAPRPPRAAVRRSSGPSRRAREELTRAPWAEHGCLDCACGSAQDCSQAREPRQLTDRGADAVTICGRARPAVATCVLVLLLSCRSKQVVVEYSANDAHVFSSAERRAIEDVAERTIPDVRRFLPDLPATIVLKARSSTHVIPETGENASNSPPNVVAWQVDAARSEGVAGIARAQLRPTLFHELHHLVRAATIDSDRLRDHIVREGLGTAFERDCGGGPAPPWGQYPADVTDWAKEVLSLPDDSPREQWLFQHPDGRRWIGFKVGTFIVDCAMKASGKTSASLVSVPTDAILAMCPALAREEDGTHGATPSPFPRRESR